MSSGKILVAQGGGPTAVINQSLVGVVLEARRHHGIDLVYGARHGVRGIVNEDFVDLTQETSHNLELVAGTPASALGSTRDKPDLAYCQEIFKVLQGARASGTSSTSAATIRRTPCASSAKKRARPATRCAASTSPRPSTTTWCGNDHTPGFPSAARFVAQAFAGANLDNAALPGVYMGVVMGRHAGFLTAASAPGQEVPRRRPAPDLPARARVRASRSSWPT